MKLFSRRSAPKPVPAAAVAAAVSEEADRRDDGRMLRHTLVIGAVIVGALLVWRLSHVLLLLFGAILVAMLLRAVADPFRRFVRLPTPLAVLAALFSLLALVALGGWAFGREVASQLSDLVERLPGAWDALRTQLASLPFGAEVAQRIDDLIAQATSAGAPAEEGADASASAPSLDFNSGLIPSGAVANLGAVAGMIGSAVTELVLVVVAGVFLALSPHSYRDGVVRLFEKRSPEAARVVGKAFDVAGKGLSRWLLGQLAAMVCIGVVTGLGAWAIGLPSPIALGMIAGVLEFVTLLGPILATIPALLLAATMGPQMILWTLLLYLVIQQVEGNVIVPLVQKRLVSLPPVISLFALLIFGGLFGPLGLMLATPLAVVVFVIVKGVYLEEPISRAG